jgi:hypothetical protein
MKKTILTAAIATLVAAGTAAAHPTDVAYETRGECERAYAEANKLDRERLVALGIFETNGAAQRTFRELFACEYDEDDDLWYIVFIG